MSRLCGSSTVGLDKDATLYPLDCLSFARTHRGPSRDVKYGPWYEVGYLIPATADRHVRLETRLVLVDALTLCGAIEAAFSGIPAGKPHSQPGEHSNTA